MKTFIAVNVSLLPFIAFWALMGANMPDAAMLAALGLAVTVLGLRTRQGEVKSLDLAAITCFFSFGVARLAGWNWLLSHATAASFAVLGLFCVVTVAVGRPWTAEYSRAAFVDVSDSAIFRVVNSAISGMWGIIFIFQAGVIALSLGAIPAVAATAVGMLVSLFAPSQLPRIMARNHLRPAESYHWRAPAIGKTHADDSFDVAVIGAGNGGLTAAALLADAGAKVVVAERGAVPGGFCHDWYGEASHAGEMRRFRFDGGVHDVSGVRPGGAVTSILERLGVAQDIRWERLDYRLHFGSLKIDVPRDWQVYARDLGALYPASASGIETFFRDVRAIYDGMFASAPDHSGVPGPPRTVDDVLAFPQRHPLTFRWMRRPFSEFLSAHVSDPVVQRLLMRRSGYITDDFASLTVEEMAPLYGYEFFGGFYPLGGSGRIADVLATALLQRRGTLLVNTEVDQIIVEQGKAAAIQLADGRRIKAARVISNADFKKTFLDLIQPKHLPADFLAAVKSARPSCSAFTVNLGLDFIPELPPVCSITPETGRGFGLTMPSLVDSSAAPAGYATLQIVKLIPNAEARTWLAAPADEEHRRRRAFGDELIARAEVVIPDLKSHIVFRSDASPVTFAHYGGSSEGAIYGVEKRVRLKGNKSPISGLFIAGGSHIVGTEGVFISGAMAAEAMLPGLLSAPRPEYEEQGDLIPMKQKVEAR